MVNIFNRYLDISGAGYICEGILNCTLGGILKRRQVGFCVYREFITPT